MVALIAIGSIGYLGASALRARHSPSLSSRETGTDELPLSDYRLIENLALYVAADDMDFVQRLAEAEFFGDDPLQTPTSRKAPLLPPSRTIPPVPPSICGPRHSRHCHRPDRTRSVRLDRQLNTLDAANRNRLIRALEAYAVWLDRLPDSERKGSSRPRRRAAGLRSFATFASANGSMGFPSRCGIN